jgi:hypothetical protein
VEAHPVKTGWIAVITVGLLAGAPPIRASADDRSGAGARAAAPSASHFEPAAYPGNPDSNRSSFRSTNVLRREFKPGSAVYVVWQQGREDVAAYGRCRRDLGGLFGIPASNVLLVKFSYWLNLQGLRTRGWALVGQGSRQSCRLDWQAIPPIMSLEAGVPLRSYNPARDA